MEPSNLRYNWADPDVYESFMGRWSEKLARQFVSRLNVAPDHSILDLGCGTGVLSRAMADAGARVIGVDATESYLDAARKRRSGPNVTYEHGDARRLRFGDGIFDAAVSSLALDVIPEAAQVVAEMKRVTRAGGMVASAVHQFFGGMSAWDLLIHTGAVLEPAFVTLREMRSARQAFWPGGQAALWREVGLIDVQETPVVVDCEYTSFADYWTTFTDGPGSATATVMALSEDARARVAQHVRTGYLLGLPDGPRSFPMVFRIVTGTVPA